MTLPASFPLSMSQIATELGLSLPLSLNHSWVLQLAQVGGLPLSFSQLLGKTGRFDGSLATSSGGGSNFVTISSPFFGGTIDNLVTGAGFNETQLNFSVAPNWAGNILAKNNTTGASVVLPKINATTWQTTFVANLVRAGQTDSFTILPST